jgi:riboflavin kinase/FMN adenylyltransferase
MLHFNSMSEVPSGFSGSAVTIGKFDALHLGHQHLLHQLTEVASKRQLKSVVVTFDRHPFTVLQPGKAPQPIIGPQQKVAHLSELQIDALVTLQFDDELAKLTPEDFVKSEVSDGWPRISLRRKWRGQLRVARGTRAQVWLRVQSARRIQN